MKQHLNLYAAFHYKTPLETVNGVPAKILSAGGPAGKPFIVQVGDHQVYNYTGDGKRSRTSIKGTGLDLRIKEEKPKPQYPKSKKIWVNISVYPEGRDEPLVVAYKHDSREEAYKWAADTKNVKVVAFPVEIPINNSSEDMVTMYTRDGYAINQPRDIAMGSITYVHKVHQSDIYKASLKK